MTPHHQEMWPKLDNLHLRTLNIVLVANVYCWIASHSWLHPYCNVAECGVHNPLTPNATVVALVLKHEVILCRVRVLTTKLGLLLLCVGSTYSFVVCIKLISKDRSFTSSRLTVVSREAKKAQIAHPTKKRDHYCESFTWRNGFVIFKNIVTYLKIRMVKSQTHERIHPSYHRHKTFVLHGIIHHMKFQSSLYNCLLIKLTSPTHYNEFFKIWFSFSFFSSSSQPIWQPYSYQRACMTKILTLSWTFGSMYVYSENC